MPVDAAALVERKLREKHKVKRDAVHRTGKRRSACHAILQGTAQAVGHHVHRGNRPNCHGLGFRYPQAPASPPSRVGYPA